MIVVNCTGDGLHRRKLPQFRRPAVSAVDVRRTMGLDK
jgi:hypothetical protein